MLDGDQAGAGAPRFGYVVLAHTDAPAVLRLVRRVRALSPTASVLVRHAQPAGFLDEADAAAAGASVLRSEITVSWGLWTLTNAAVEALEHARATTSADWHVLVSGQDHPVRDLAEWEREIVASGAGAAYRHFGSRHQDWQFRWRVVRLPAALTSLPRPVRYALERVWRRLGSPVLDPVVKFYRLGNRSSAWGLALRRPRTVLTGPPLPISTGSFWLAVSSEALDRLLARHRADADLRGWFAPTLVADEHYLQSLLVDDPLTTVVDAVVTWQHVPAGDWNATELTPEQVDVAARSGAAFARKVAGPRAAEVVARADALTGRAAAAPAAPAQAP